VQIHLGHNDERCKSFVLHLFSNVLDSDVANLCNAGGYSFVSMSSLNTISGNNRHARKLE